jgi:hypothetical protein
MRSKMKYDPLLKTSYIELQIYFLPTLKSLFKYSAILIL